MQSVGQSPARASGCGTKGIGVGWRAGGGATAHAVSSNAMASSRGINGDCKPRALRVHSQPGVEPWVGDGSAVAHPLKIRLRWQHCSVEGCPIGECASLWRAQTYNERVMPLRGKTGVEGSIQR